MKILVDADQLHNVIMKAVDLKHQFENNSKLYDMASYISGELSSMWFNGTQEAKSEINSDTETQTEEVIHTYYFDDEISSNKIDKNKHYILAILDLLNKVDKKLNIFKREVGHIPNLKLHDEISQLKNKILG